MGRLARLPGEAGLVATAGGLLLSQAARSIQSLQASEAWWVISAALLLGVVSADFATGAVHWFCDRFFRATTPVIGPALIQPFREHHVDPQAMVRHGLLELHANTAIPVIAVLAAAHLSGPKFESPGAVAFQLWLFFLCGASMATNQFHLWAHAPSVPRPVRWLQRHGLILSPEHHARHHRGHFDRSYCITLGWMNPLLDRIDFFGRLERGIRAAAQLRHVTGDRR
jgi:ubiquitin-conjugating enzyme E2 variant